MLLVLHYCRYPFTYRKKSAILFSTFIDMTNHQRLSKYAIHQLLQFLLTIFEQQRSFEALFHLTQKNITDWLTQLPPLLDLVDINTQIRHISIEEALHFSSHQTPVVGVLENGSVYVFYGFSMGHFRVAHIHEEQLDKHLLSLNETVTFLNATTQNTFDFLILQPKKPLEQAVSHGHEHLPPFQRLVTLLQVERTDLGLILGLAMGSGLLALSAPIAVQAVVNTVAMGGMGQPLAVLSMILFIFLAFSGAIYVLESYLAEMIQRRLFVRLATDLAYRIPKISSHLHDKHRGAELINRFFDIQTVQKFCSGLLLDGLRLLMQTLAGLTLLAFYHPFLLSFDIFLLSSIAFILFVLGQGAVKTSIAESKAKYALVDWLEVIADNKNTFKAASSEQFAQERTDILAHDYLKQKMAHYRILFQQIMGSMTLYVIANTGLLSIGGYLVIEGQLTLGQLVAAELIVSTVLAALIKFGKHLESFYDLLTAVDKIGHLLDLPLEEEKGSILSFSKPISIDVEHLSFHFTPPRDIVSNLHFSVHSSEKVALFGQGSCGKTTLAELLFGLRQGQKGTILFDNIRLQNIHLPTLREQICLINDIEIIEGSLFDNIVLGREHIEAAQVEQVLSDLGLLEELMVQFGQTLSLPISTTGAPLSKTQQRLLMLARGVINRPVLILVDSLLDEFDEKTQRHIMMYLVARSAPWTLLIFTQNTAIASQCERVISLD
ncbi:MAG: ATP-binding cassette, subfamily bacterial [Pseudomonadota bacterium]|nr:ATP-binding cassette, subfamily bacterial [Pseudomonadota bacterium]